MIFGRKKSTEPPADDEGLYEDDVELAEDDVELAEDELTEHDLDDDSELSDEEELTVEPDQDADQWELLDASSDWREDGPFDVSEVELDADDIERLDFGTLVLTPFDGMQMQLQVDQETNLVQAVLVMHEQSAIEIALFAAPAQSSLLSDIRREMSDAAEAAGGSANLVAGPFGTEIRRVIPVQGSDGQQGYHVSRTWFAAGPKWLLRGVLMGEAGMKEVLEGADELLFEFFCNAVVRRGHDPRVPGDLIPMTIPESLLRSEAE